MRVKNFLSFLTFNIVFCTIFYLLEFRLLFISLIMILLNTILFFIFKNKNLEYGIALAENFIDITDDFDFDEKDEDDIYLDEINNIVKILFFKDLKIIFYFFINIYVLIFFYALIGLEKSLKNFVFYVFCTLLTNIVFIFIEKTDANLFVKYKDINTLNLIYNFTKVSTYKTKSVKLFVEKASEKIEKDFKKPIKNGKLAFYFKVTNLIEAYPYDTNPILEEKYENILDKIHDLNRLVETDNSKLNLLNISQFETCTNLFLSFLDNNRKNSSKEKVLDILNEYEKYIDNIINNLNNNLDIIINMDTFYDKI